MNLVKAELLLTRKCNLCCTNCGMLRDNRMEMSTDKWLLGLDNLKSLGCNFIALYGGEPFLSNSLEQILIHSKKLNMLNTVITNLTYKNELFRLIEEGVLNSITLSIDTLQNDKMDIRAKNSVDIFDKLSIYLKEGKLRDVGICATVGRHNFKELPALIELYTERGFWSLFDILHYDRGQGESKCANKELLKNKIFREEDMEEVRKVFAIILKMKQSGNFLIHPSARVINMWQKQNYVVDYQWVCTEPYFVTVDCDGSMMMCDDYTTEQLKEFKVWELKKRWEDFNRVWFSIRNISTCHCFWNTHIDAEEIYLGKLPFEDYIHQKQ